MQDNTEVRKKHGRRRKRKRKSTYRRTLKIVLGFLIFVFVLLTSALLFWEFGPQNLKNDLLKALSRQQIVRNIVAEEVKDDFEEKVQDKDFNKDDIIVNEEVEKKLTGYQNIVLFGIDARDDAFDAYTRSDTMMIISINNDTGAVRMVSLYRDTYLNIIQDDGTTFYSKANAAYSMGGSQGAVSTLNTNLDLNIDDYIVVNFSGLSEIIDLIGGIDINISDLEMRRINKIGSDMEAESDREFTEVQESGLVHLDGFQATAYCRIRDAVFTDAEGNEYHYDFGRTARQRYVMQELVVKAKASGISTLLNLAKQALNMNTEDKIFMKTSLEYDEIMDLVPVMIDYNIEASSGFPFTLQTPNIDGADLVVAEGMACNVSALHSFLFNDKDYQPSKTVNEIDSYIINRTGVQPCIPILGEVENIAE